MKFSKILRRMVVGGALLGLVAAFEVSGGIVKELPTVRVNGKVLYYYDTQSGDNIYTVADKLGVSVEDIRRNNPSVADGVKPRMRLFFPLDMAAQNASAESYGTMTHVVEKGESVYGIARRYGITMDQLMAANPSAANGLVPGMRLVVKGGADAKTPGGKAASAVSSDLAAISSSPATSSSSSTSDRQPVMAGPARDDEALSSGHAEDEAEEDAETQADTPEMAAAGSSETDSYLANAAADSSINAEAADSAMTAEAADSVASGELNIAVILPFMLDESHIGRQTQLYTEFYKGFLLAADTLNRAGRTPVKIHAYDSAASIDTVRAIMRRPEIAGMDMIVAPDNVSQISAICSAAPEKALILNIFAVKDTSFQQIPGLIQTNIPHDEMYEHAAKGFIDLYTGVTPVFVSRLGGRADKEEFTSMLKSELSRNGIAYKTIAYDSHLTDADLEEFDPVVNNYVFIPVSGNRDELQRMMPALKTLRGRALDPSAVRLFGYPEWATYRGTQLDELCELETSIYSRYAPASDDADARRLNDAFRRNFGEGLIDKQMPVLGILGFDTGMMVIDGLRTKAGRGEFPERFVGIQSGLNLERYGEDGGQFNNAVFIITFHPGGAIDKILK